MGRRILKYFLLLSAGLSPSRTPGQETIRKYVAEHAISMSTIQPDSGDDANLDAIGASIGDAKIVLLGEQDHGDAPTFLAKTRLIRYLHEKKGFNILAFESDFFGLSQGWERLPKEEKDIDSFIRRNVFPTWTSCSTCRDLFYSYIPHSFTTVNPLQLAGVDNQVFLSYSARYLSGWMDSVIRDLRLPIINNPEYPTKVLPMLDSLKRWYVRPKDTTLMTTCGIYLDSIRQQAAMRIKEQDFRMRVIDNLIAELHEFQSLSDNRAVAAIRDKQMARNLAWLTDVRYPGGKIIVWAASVHIGRVAGNFPGLSYNNLPTLGDEFISDPGHRRETYIMGFTSFEGTAGRLGGQVYEVRKPRPDAFERWIDPSINYGFVDFRQYNLTNPGKEERFFLSGFGHIGAEGIWNRVFDGVIYIKTMYPCDR